jgi:hypothetical protein
VNARTPLERAGFPALLFALNLYFTWDLFALNYSLWMGSIEAAYLGISRYMIENWRDLSWFPLWYGGIPFQNTYPPLLHALVAMGSAATCASVAHAHHITTALFYCAGPVGVYSLAVRLTSSRWCGFWAGLAYTILSPSIFLIRDVRTDIGGLFALRRLHVLVYYGEGPHIAALALIPFALAALDLAIEKRRPVFYAIAALLMAAVALSNWLGAFGLALGVLAYVIAKFRVEVWMRIAAVALLAYALACPWIPPSTIRDIRYNAQFVGDFRHVYERFPLYAGAGLIALACVKFVLRRRPKPLQFALFFALLTAGVTLSAEWFGILIVPQPQRYHLEMDLALCIAAAILIQRLVVDRLQPRARIAAIFVVLALCVWPIRLDRRYARRSIHPVNVETTFEYQMARWFSDHIGTGRVIVPATVSYWLNAFSDTPQLGGGFDQGITNRTFRIAHYLLSTCENTGAQAGELTTLWMKAYGVEAIELQGPNSRELYKPFRAPDRFRDQLAPVWREGDDAVYRVPLDSLAHVIPSDRLVRDPPYNGLDVTQIRRYVEAFDDRAQFRWTTRHSAQVRAAIAPGELLSVQVSYHPGWRAAANGVASRVFPDGLGQIAIEPRCSGACVVELIYDGGLEMRLARIASGLAAVFVILWITLPAILKLWR